ncbi:retron Ec48 family effector membrane protein [Pseudomonas wenzhouensis]|nr:retron Ec48 family effector membrane protein [Pseudomonas wenzhouensis]
MAILSLTGGAVIGLVTISGIIIALLSYQSSVRSSAISNHLSHISLFSNYVHAETLRRTKISRFTIEALKWYNLIYSDSINGSLDISSTYADFITRLSAQISSSSKIYSSKEKKWKHLSIQGTSAGDDSSLV